MPPHELPMKCVRCTPSPSRMSTMQRAQSSKVNGAMSFWLSPKPGGSTRITWFSAPKWSACAAHISPVISRLGQNIIASPLPRTCTRTDPSTVSSRCCFTGQTLALRTQCGPPDGRADHREQGWNDHGAHYERVEQDAEAHDDADLGQHDQRQHSQDTEDRGEHDARAGDDRTCRRYRPDDAVSGALLRCFLSRPGDQEDRVIHPEGHQEQEG